MLSCGVRPASGICIILHQVSASGLHQVVVLGSGVRPAAYIVVLDPVVVKHVL